MKSYIEHLQHCDPEMSMVIVADELNDDDQCSDETTKQRVLVRSMSDSLLLQPPVDSRLMRRGASRRLHPITVNNNDNDDDDDDVNRQRSCPHRTQSALADMERMKVYNSRGNDLIVVLEEESSSPSSSPIKTRRTPTRSKSFDSDLMFQGERRKSNNTRNAPPRPMRRGSIGETTAAAAAAVATTSTDTTTMATDDDATETSSTSSSNLGVNANRPTRRGSIVETSNNNNNEDKSSSSCYSLESNACKPPLRGSMERAASCSKFIETRQEEMKKDASLLSSPPDSANSILRLSKSYSQGNVYRVEQFSASLCSTLGDVLGMSSLLDDDDLVFGDDDEEPNTSSFSNKQQQQQQQQQSQQQPSHQHHHPASPQYHSSLQPISLRPYQSIGSRPRVIEIV